MPTCLMPTVSVEKLSPIDIESFAKSQNREKIRNAFMQKSRAARNDLIDKRRQKLKEENVVKLETLQKFLDCTASAITEIQGKIGILQPWFKAIADIDRDNYSVASSSHSESSRPRRKVTAPQRFSYPAQEPSKPKTEKSLKVVKADAEQCYEVEAIRNINLIDSKVHFFVKWKNWPERTNTWEPFECVKECAALEEALALEWEGQDEAIKLECERILGELQGDIQARLTGPESKIIEELKGFDPLEYKSNQIVHMLTKDQGNYYKNFRKTFHKMMVTNYFYHKRIEQTKENLEIGKNFRERENNVFEITIKNDVDFDHFPEFIYVSEIILPRDVELQVQVNGCVCPGGCDRASKSCCPKTVKQNFAYKFISGKKRLRLGRHEMIVECNDNCSCDKDCLNRVTQQPRLFPLQIFKTSNGRGWGLKTMANIPTGSFIIEYTGEIIDQSESIARGRKYDELEQSYLFDLDYNEQFDAVYTIDAFSCGNLSRLINHSCEPNCKIWPVTTCGQIQSIYKLCFFSTRLIKEGEELTFDYSGGPLEPVNTVVEEGDTLVSGTQISRRYANTNICKCGSDFCRGVIFDRQPSVEIPAKTSANTVPVPDI